MSKPATTKPRTAQQIDKDIGLRIRSRRMEMKISQDKLGTACGVTFQQIQKYEKGVNRVSPSMMTDIARKLQVKPSQLFSAPDDISPSTYSAGMNFLTSPDGAKIVRAFEVITDSNMRAAISSLALRLAGTQLQAAE